MRFTLGAYTGFCFGTCLLAFCVSLKKNPIAPEDAPVSQGTKVIVRREIQLRFYAEDGSFMLASDTEYIDGNVGDEIASEQWRNR